MIESDVRNLVWSQTTEIDEGLYSRQLYVIGKDAMQHLAKASILICGMRGLGVEIAKNLILGGVRSVIVQDSKTVEYEDLSSQYYLRESDIGKNRAEVVREKLAELNSYVHVTYSSQPIVNYLLSDSNIQVFVLTDSSHDEQLLISIYCRQHHIKLIIANTRGLFGQVFCDFGDKFVVNDRDGRSPRVKIITHIGQDKKGVVLLPANSRHGFIDGTYVTFSGVKGMTEVNRREFQITVLNPFAFTIGDTRDFGAYESGGTVTEVKKPITVNFKSFSDSLSSPAMMRVDFSKQSMPMHLHLAFQGFSSFQTKYDEAPKPWDEDDAEKFFEIVAELNFTMAEQPMVKELNKHWIKLFSKTCRGDLCPMQSIIGGIAAQEVMKAITGKFTPINQYLYIDACECLPEDVFVSNKTPLSSTEFPVKLSRYYSQEIVFGEDFQHRLGEAKYFVVGSGAIGCEMLKNLAMMGIGCEKDGAVFVTDMDSIEKSNLNRQFLFRPSDIGKMKSKVAADAVKVMNPDMNVVAYTDAVAMETEHIFHDSFFDELNGVITALDNVEARKYIDLRCLYYQKPMIDSGTLGTNGSVQVVVPFLTQSYSDTNDPVDQPVPMCTLRHFPNTIEHAIEWARDNFASLFMIPAQQAEEFMRDPERFAQRVATSNSVIDKKEMITHVQQMLRTDRPKSFFDCISWARHLFEKQFNNSIAQLLYNYPPDHLTSKGERFWTGIKRCPHLLKFDVSNPTHLDFIVAASNLIAYIYSISAVRAVAQIAQQVVQIGVPEFQPILGVTIHENDEALKADLDQQNSRMTSMTSNRESEVQKILVELPKKDEWHKIELRPHEFEKDDDSNFHIDYIAACANLRAENYDIEPVDRNQIKLIAGRIIPAIATTTALVAGLACLELYKLSQNHKNIKSYRNIFLNLALPLITFLNPMGPRQQQYLDRKFSSWDYFHIKEDVTFEEMIEHFKREYQLYLTVIYAGFFLLYDPDKAEMIPVLKRRITEQYELVTKKSISPHIRSLALIMWCNDVEGNDIPDVPYIKLKFR